MTFYVGSERHYTSVMQPM